MVDEKTKSEWEKSKRIEEERMKAARDLNTRSENKSNLAFMPITKAHGFSRDPNIVMKNAERMANISITFALLGIVFGVFVRVFSMVAQVNNLGLAGAGIMTILGGINIVSIGVAVITGIVVLICMIVFARKTNYKVKPIIITASISLTLMILYFIMQYYI